MADGEPNEQAELNIMRNYVIDRSARLGLDITHVDVEEILEAAKGLAPSDQAALSVIRAFASDDEALKELFQAAVSLARSDGDEAEDEVGLLKRMLASARRKRDKSS